MRKKIIYFIIYIFLSFPLFVSALEDGYQVNPEWITYNEATLEEKENYSVIPEQYIYVPEEEEEKPSLFSENNYATLSGDELIPSYFNLTNYNGKNYVNSPKKNQSVLGLCWGFATIGNIESTMLYHGIGGAKEMASLCTNDEDDTKYCRIKRDLQLNEAYINGEVSDPVSFSERNMDYITASPLQGKSYNNRDTTPILEQYNYYAFSRKLGSGGSFYLAIYSANMGYQTKLAEGSWDKYNVAVDTKTLAQIFDETENRYSINSYYSYASPPVAQSAKESWIVNLKKIIMEYGATYVTAPGPSSSYAGSCYYYDTKSTDFRGKPIYLLNYAGSANCGIQTASHAMQIIGWDDNYSFAYCKVGSRARDDYTEQSCTDAGYKWTSGTGAWILKNSWGSTITYPYLSYNSVSVDVAGITDISVTDYENIYNNDNSIHENTSISFKENNKTKYYSQYKFHKSKETEYLKRVNVRFAAYYQNHSISISTDGVNFTEINNEYIDYAGLYSYEVNDIPLDTEEVYVRVNGGASVSVVLYTNDECTKNNNCESGPRIKTILDSSTYQMDNNTFKINSKTQNISSGTQLMYKIFDSNNNDITNFFTINKAYLIQNSEITTMTINENLQPGEYRLETSYGDTVYNSYFSVVSLVDVQFEGAKNIFLDEGTKNYSLTYSGETSLVNSVSYGSSNNYIATINNEGVVTPLKSGKVTLSAIVETTQGNITKTIDVIVYKKISNTTDFLGIYSSDSYGAYYLTSDIDFTGVNIPYTTFTNVFNGILNGNNKKIKNISMNNEEYSSLFYMLDGATINDLSIIDSNFKSNKYAASLASIATNSTITNVVTNNIIVGGNIAGGLIANSTENTISKCINLSDVTADKEEQKLFVGGLVGYSSNDTISNTYNAGNILAKSNYNMSNGDSTYIYSGGIVGYIVIDTTINYSYNIGVVKIDSNSTNLFRSLSGIASDFTNVTNSYYLVDSNYNIDDNNSKRTLEQLKNMNTYSNWDFDNVWVLNSDCTPTINNLDIYIKEVIFNTSTYSLNVNSEYDYSYEIKPYSYKVNNISLSSTNTNILNVLDNKIHTFNLSGGASLNLNIDGLVSSYDFKVYGFLQINYNKELTNQNVTINVSYNYVSQTNTDYLKLVYTQNGNESVIQKNVLEYNNNDQIEISDNGVVDIDVYICLDQNSCNKLESRTVDINNIDKELPTLIYTIDDVNKTIKFSYNDDRKLKSNNSYLFAINDSRDNIPITFNPYENNTLYNNLIMNYVNKILWVKNIYDEAGNSLCETEYCKYDLNIDRKTFTVKYYDDDQVRMFKQEEYLEGTPLHIDYIPFKESDHYYTYTFDHWDNYTDGMVINEDLMLVGSFVYIPKVVDSNSYQISNGYIRKIFNGNVLKKYTRDSFLKNVFVLNDVSFYSNNDLINPDYIYTGLKFGNLNTKFTIVLAGDVTGDGYIKMNDVMKEAKHIVNQNILLNEYYYAGDVTNDDQVKMNDVMKMAKKIVNGGGF